MDESLAREYAKENNIHYYEVSAKTNLNIESTFQDILERVHRHSQSKNIDFTELKKQQETEKSETIKLTKQQRNAPKEDDGCGC